MNQKEDFIIGFAPTRRNIFSRQDAIKYKLKILDKIKSFGFRVIDIDDINEDGLILDEKDLKITTEKFKNNKVDCLFIPHCNFGTESAVGKLAKEINKPLLLWGPRDEAPLPDGSRLRDSQCGLFATSKILQRYNLPFSYIISSRVDSKLFEKGFNNFAKAANVVKNFNKIKIGQIGVRPGDFWSVICNEGELLEKFGIEIVPFNLIDIVLKVKKILEKPNENFKERLDFLKRNFQVEIDEESLKKIAALEVVIKTLSIENNIPAFALQCWSSLQDQLGIVPCMANSLLFDEGIPVACETDICGAITSLIVQAACFGEKPVFFADLTNRHPNNENGELLFHCGNFPYSLKKDCEKARLSTHAIFKGNIPGTGNWEIKGGEISLVRFDGINGKYSLFLGYCKGIDGPKTIGTYLWVEVKDWYKWEEKIIFGPYIHHIIGVHDKIAPVMYEASKYIKDLEFDPADPTIEEIKEWLNID